MVRLSDDLSETDLYPCASACSRCSHSTDESPSFAPSRYEYPAPRETAEVTTGSTASCDVTTPRRVERRADARPGGLSRGANGGRTVIRNRTGQVLGTANGRIQRVYAHSAFKTSGIEPEHDRLGRRARHMLSPTQGEKRSDQAIRVQFLINTEGRSTGPIIYHPPFSYVFEIRPPPRA